MTQPDAVQPEAISPEAGPPETGPATRLIGQRRPTRESRRLVRTGGEYIQDIRPAGMLHTAMVRSPHAHARIVRIDTSAAEAMPGVHAVLTGAAAEKLAKPAFTLAAFHDPPLPIPLPALPSDKARYAGEAIVAVAAASRAQAEDAAAKVVVTYEVLPTIETPEQALAQGASVIHEGLGSNLILKRHFDFGPVAESFDTAAHVVRRTLRWPRQTGAPLDTYGCICDWDESGGLTVWSNLQSYALLWTLGPSLGIAPQSVRGLPCDIGGSFGGKFWQPRPILICAMLSKITSRPVRFIEDRVESLIGGENHGEDRTYDAELAIDGDGRFTALRFAVVEDYGSAFVLGAINNAEPLAQATGPYDIGALGVDFTAVLTNKTPQAAYRGFGGAAHNFMVERLVDAAADELGIDRVEIRRRNLIPPDAFPYRTPTGNLYDSGQYPKALSDALEFADYDTWRQRQAEARSEGRAIGIGVVTCQERSVQGASALWVMFDQNPARGSTSAESATVRVDGQGHVRIALHTPSVGTPLETVAATVAAEALGVDPDDIAVTFTDSQMAGPGLGTTASRMTVMLAGAVQGAADDLIKQMRPIAADLLEADPGDLTWDAASSSFAVTGVPGRSAPLARIAHRAYSEALSLPDGSRTGLECTFSYDHPIYTMPEPDGSSWGVFCPIVGNSVHIPVVEVDVETGQVHFLDYAVVHDCGTVLNPDAVRGQLLGGIAQGVGSALTEVLNYTDGQLQQRDFRSYLVPTTIDVPVVRIQHLQTPSPFTPFGVKGVGEGGRMAAPAAVVSAIEDALRPWNVRIDAVPVTPEDILRWVADS